LFKAMAGAAGGALTPEELAKKTGTHPRIIREWLGAQTAGGFVTYNPSAGTYRLPEEQALALTDENSPAYIAGFYQVLAGLYKD
jgi:SAM-dependent methyltransferase